VRAKFLVTDGLAANSPMGFLPVFNTYGCWRSPHFTVSTVVQICEKAWNQALDFDSSEED